MEYTKRIPKVENPSAFLQQIRVDFLALKTGENITLEYIEKLDKKKAKILELKLIGYSNANIGKRYNCTNQNINGLYQETLHYLRSGIVGTRRYVY